MSRVTQATAPPRNRPARADTHRYCSQISQRAYTLLDNEVLIPVSTMIRLRDFKFYRTQGGPQGRELRTQTASGEDVRGGRSQLSFLDEHLHNMILWAIGEQGDKEETNAGEEGAGETEAGVAEAAGGG